MYGPGVGNNTSVSIYLGEVGDSGNNFRGPNYYKDSFIKAYRTEFKARMWFLNNTLLDPENLQTLTYGTVSGGTNTYFNYIQSQSGGYSVAHFNSVNTQVAQGVFYKPTRPTNIAPPNAAAVLPGANLVGSAYGYNAAYTHTAPPRVRIPSRNGRFAVPPERMTTRRLLLPAHRISPRCRSRLASLHSDRPTFGESRTTTPLGIHRSRPRKHRFRTGPLRLRLGTSRLTKSWRRISALS
jgi:hypothetical protein